MTVLGIIVDVIVFIIIAGNAVAGYKMGMTRVIFNIFSSLIAIILVFILYKPVSNYIFDHTKMAQNLENAIVENLSEYLKNEEETAVSNKEEANNMLAMFMGQDMNEMVQNTTDGIVTNASKQIAYRIVSGAVFLILFTVIRLALYLLKNYADFLANLPFIRVINSSGGMIYGVVKGFLLVYVVFAIISFMMPMIGDTIIVQAIDEAFIGSKMFQSNIILNVIFKFL